MWGPQTIPNPKPQPQPQAPIQTMSATKPKRQPRTYSAHNDFFGQNPSNCYSEGKQRNRVNSSDQQQITSSINCKPMPTNINRKSNSIGQYITHDLLILFDILGAKVDDLLMEKNNEDFPVVGENLDPRRHKK